MWMDVRTVVQSEVRKRKTNIIPNTDMWNLEKCIDDLICKAEIET